MRARTLLIIGATLLLLGLAGLVFTLSRPSSQVETMKVEPVVRPLATPTVFSKAVIKEVEKQVAKAVFIEKEVINNLGTL